MKDVRLFNNLLKFLEKYKLNWIINENLIEIVTEGDYDLELKERDGIENFIKSILCKIYGKEKFYEVLVGIDINDHKKIFIAIIADGELIFKTKTNLNEIKEILDIILKILNTDNIKIGIGNANKYSILVYNLLKIHYNLKIKLVNEERTSKKTPFLNINDEDIRAAINIALRSSL